MHVIFATYFQNVTTLGLCQTVSVQFYVDFCLSNDSTIKNIQINQETTTRRGKNADINKQTRKKEMQ